jgi:type VI secretion system protein ImpM
MSTLYFGKLASRGDFVRGGQHRSLIDTLDRWLTHGMELLSTDARWKETYDRTPPINFAFLGTSSHVALAGHIVASADTSGRRFPFLVAGSFEVQSPAWFLARGPMALAPPWQALEVAAREACAAEDAGPRLGELLNASMGIHVDAQACEAEFRDFIDRHTVGSLQDVLQQAGHAIDLRQTLLALGMLLQPLPASGARHLDKGLRLPLPADALRQPCVAAMWLELVSRFLRVADFELVLFMPPAAPAEAPTLALGFSGGSPRLLHAALDPRVGEEVFVDLRRAPWVDDPAGQDYAVRKLSSYLQQPQLSLKQAVSTFRETFLGE